jgi:hypothetical protein
MVVVFLKEIRVSALPRLFLNTPGYFSMMTYFKRKIKGTCSLCFRGFFLVLENSYYLSAIKFLKKMTCFCFSSGTFSSVKILGYKLNDSGDFKKSIGSLN